MVTKAIVTKIYKNKSFYSPHIVTDKSSFAGIPEELIDKIEVNDEVTIYSSEDLCYGGISAIVIETPKAKLENM